MSKINGKSPNNKRKLAKTNGKWLNFQINDECSDPLEYDELYNIHYEDRYCNNKENTSKQFKIMKQYNICEYYNPYFLSGCVYGRKCQYSHLSETAFLKYCRYHSFHHLLDSTASQRFQKALKCVETNKINKAFYILKQLVLDYELNAVFNFWFARCHHLFPNASNEDMNAAQFYYRKSISISPNNASFHGHYAQFSVEWAKKLKLRMRCSEYKQAKDHFRKSLRIRKSTTIHFMFAKFLDEVENEYNEAQFHYEETLRVITDDIRIRLNYARCLHKMNKYKSSKKQFEMIFNSSKNKERENSLLWPHFHFGKLLKDMQFYEQSKEQFSVCCDLMDWYNNRYYSEIYYEFAQLLTLYFNEYHDALHYANLAIKMSPERRYYKKLLYGIQEGIRDENQEHNKCIQTPTVCDENQDDNNIQRGFNFGYNQCYDDDKDNDDEPGTSGNAFAFGPFVHNATNMEELGSVDNDRPENEFLANRFCATEFDRFISSDISFGVEFEKYCDKFEEEKMNDIRHLLNKRKILNETWLRNKIGMNDRSIQLWKRSVGIFNDQYRRYVSWLHQNDFYNKYFRTFETYGILHLQSFFYHVKNVDDVLYMIREKNKNNAEIIWKSAQKEINKIMKYINSQTERREVTDEHKQQLL